MPIPIIMGGLALGALSERYQVGPNYKDILNVTTGYDETMETIAFNRAKQVIVSEEGRRNVVYADSLGIPTGGIGHKITTQDRLSVGDSITNEKIDQWFANDINLAFNAATSQAKELEKYNADMIARLTSVNFQLGIYWRTKFPNTWTLIKAGKIAEVQKTLLVPKYDAKGAPLNWYAQTPNRVIAFVQTLQTQFA